MLIEFGWTQIYVCLIVLVIILFFVWIKHRDFAYILFCAIFGIYLIAVISVVVFPFPVGIVNLEFKPSLNLIPFYFGDCQFGALCLKGIYQNILLTVPFGFGINFIIYIKPTRMFWLAFVVGLVFEVTQLIISIMVRSPFRAVDINDLIFNAVGVLFGYCIFRTFGIFYIYLLQKFQIQPRAIFADLHEVVRK